MSDYIMSMRKLVGQIPLLQCGASVIVENTRGEILLQQRADNSCWSYSGGSVELDEDVEDIARRELFEETGHIAYTLEFFGIFYGSEFNTPSTSKKISFMNDFSDTQTFFCLFAIPKYLSGQTAE